MRELVNLTGMVLKASPVGDNDRRLVLLTRERGKITAFARGAKRPGSQLMGVTRPFVFGNFRLYEGRDACNLQGADVLNYFAEITLDMEATCYGSYFLELADYYGRENLEAAELLLLLYQSLRALLKPAASTGCVRTSQHGHQWRLYGASAQTGQRFRQLCVGVYHRLPVGISVYVYAGSGSAGGTAALCRAE